MIRIGQTLHGYEDGHSLLASSDDLPYEAESTLFVLSDLSGQSFVRGFDEYVTGYPLSEMHSYAIGKTWYAPEMERPGCVWTHTLIIRFGDLARINNLASLLDLFARPTRSSKSWKRYESHVSFDESGLADKGVSYDLNSNLHQGMQLCDALYGKPILPVVVPALESSIYENEIFDLWSQQWPRLRRNFSFCSGSIESREVDGHPFDLQCMPLDYSSLGSMLPPNAIVISPSVPKRLPERTLRLIVDDLQRPNESLRNFVRNYGADAPGERASFAAMVELWEQLSKGIASEDDFANFAKLVSRSFPMSESVAKLRRDVVLDDDVDGIRICLPVQDRLIALLLMKSEEEPVDFIDVSALMRQLVDTDSEAFIRLLDRLIRLHRLSNVTSSLLDLAASLIDIEVIERTASQQLMLVLVSIHPQLLRHPEICRSLSQRGHELVDIFAARNSSADEWRDLLEALISNDLQQTASLAFMRAPMDLVTEVLEIFEKVDSYRDSFAAWFTEVERRQLSAVVWLQTRESLSVANRLGLSLVLDPVYCSRSNVPATLFRGVEEDTNERRLTFAFVLSGEDKRPDAAWIFSLTFRKIHRIVTKGDVEYFSWRILQQVLPELSFFGNWDQAERLRRYYATKYAYSGWPERPFWEGLEGQEVTWEILEYIASEKPLRAFGRSLIRDSYEFSLPSWQADIIRNAPRKIRA
jgi:GTPase-associated protein 1, N-terminal domain type 1